MPITCEVQRFDYFHDQTENLGEVTLEAALLLFEKFDFSGQFEEMKERQVSSCNPTVTYRNSKGPTLIISAADESEFYITYKTEDEYADLVLPMSVHLNPNGRSPEDYLHLFFNGTLEEHLFLKPMPSLEPEAAEKSRENEEAFREHPFSLSRGLRKWIYSLPFLIMHVMLINIMPSNVESQIIFHGLMCFFWLPSTLLLLTYSFHDGGVRLIVSETEKSLTLIKGEKEHSFSRDQIYRCEVIEARKGPWMGFRYLWIVLKDRRKFVITNLVAEPSEVVDYLNLHHTVDQVFIPFIIK